MWFFLKTIVSPIPIGCPTIQFEHYLELASVRSHKLKSLVPQYSPHFRCQPQMGSPSGPHFHLTNYKFKSSHEAPPSQVREFTGTTHRTPESALITIIVYYKGYKWTTRWRYTQGKIWEGPKCRNFCSCGVRTHHPRSTCRYSPTQKFPESWPLGVLWKFHYTGTTDWIPGHWWLTSNSSLSALPGGWRAGLKVLTLLSYDWFFW